MLGKIITIVFLIILTIFLIGYFNHTFSIDKLISSTPVQTLSSYTVTNVSVVGHEEITNYSYSFTIYSNTSSTIEYPVKLPGYGKVVVMAYFSTPTSMAIIDNGSTVFKGVETYLYKEFYGGGNLTLVFNGKLINASIIINETILTSNN